MRINTKCFGEIDVTEDKVITFTEGLLGFEEYKRFTLLYNNEEGKKSNVSWLQSMDEEKLAFPVIIPCLVKEDYQPIINEGILKNLGELNDDNTVVLLTISVPKDVTNMTANLRAPLIINSDMRIGYQVIVENQDYEIKYRIYDIIQRAKEQRAKEAAEAMQAQQEEVSAEVTAG